MGELGTFLVILLIFVVATNPWLLIVARVIIVLCIFLCVKYPNSGGTGGYSSSGVSYSSGEDSSSCLGGGSDNGFLWEGRFKTGYDPVIATFRNGYVFEGYNSGLHDFSVIKASYQDGWIYEGSVTNYLGNVLGRYENGYIYRGNSTFFSDCIGRYEDGKIYKGKTHLFPAILLELMREMVMAQQQRQSSTCWMRKEEIDLCST